MSIVRTDIPMTYDRAMQAILALTEKYPFLRSEVLDQTAFGRDLRTLVIGNGPRKVVFSASHHANEWITTPVLLKFMEEFAEAIQTGGDIAGYDAKTLAENVTIYALPMVDPDGVDLVTGAIEPDSFQYNFARRLGQNYPEIPFPEGWKANLLGVDLNLQYPAQWDMAKEIKFSQGFTVPGPRDFVGAGPLTQIEARRLHGYTQYLDPALVLALHSQGGEIYWKFLDIEVPGARELGEEMARVSGYRLADTPYASGFAGYKDWFVQDYRRPGYTIEVGRGTNPLPLAQFEEIYADVKGILAVAAAGKAESQAAP